MTYHPTICISLATNTFLASECVLLRMQRDVSMGSKLASYLETGLCIGGTVYLHSKYLQYVQNIARTFLICPCV